MGIFAPWLGCGCALALLMSARFTPAAHRTLYYCVFVPLVILAGPITLLLALVPSDFLRTHAERVRNWLDNNS